MWLRDILGPGGGEGGAWRQIVTHVIIPMCFEDASEAIGHPCVIMHLSDQLKFTTDTMDEAAARGLLDVVKWLSANRREGCTTHAADWAAAAGYLDVVRWLHENRTEGCSTQAMDSAAQNGHLDVVRWLRDQLANQV